MLSPFAEAIASRREIACSAVSDFGHKNPIRSCLCGMGNKAYSLHPAKDILQVYAPTRLKSC